MFIYIYIIAYILSFVLAKFSLYIASGVVLLGAALVIFISEYKRTGMLINLRGLFTLSFVGGQGISCMKISNLQTDWRITTWISFFLAFTAFWGVYEFCQFEFGRIERKSIRRNGVRINRKRLLISGIAITAVSLIAFFVEVFKLKFVPLFVRGVPHAYSTFHITGVHYFTVACVLVPAISVVYFYYKNEIDSEYILFLILDIISLMIPILCVSRFQFILSIMLATVSYVVINRGRSQWVLCLAGIGILPVYLILTVARSHGIEYLNSIFEMKYNLPVFVGQPYIYVANNYDNFNALVVNLNKFAFGMKGLFPVWALSGMKFVYPNLVDYPIFVTKTELTTLTLFYDAYYDFWIIGVAVFSAVLGLISYLMENELKEYTNPILVVVYSQMVLYLSLSFFTTWFSNPTTWFYLVVTTLVYFFTNKVKLHQSYGRYL